MNPLYFESSTKVGLVEFPIRATLLPHKGGAVLISPIEFNEAQVQVLKQFNVTDIVAPSDIHHLFILDANKLFPGARLWRPPGLEKKRPDVPWTHVLGKSPWLIEEIKVLPVEGAPKINEYLFFHSPSKTLVVTDLLFNVIRPEGVAAKIIFTIMGTYNGLAMSRLWKVAIQDKAKFKASVEEVLKLDIENLALAHGGNVALDGKRLLLGALAERGFNF